eukprot:s3881_g2.t1
MRRERRFGQGYGGLQHWLEAEQIWDAREDLSELEAPIRTRVISAELSGEDLTKIQSQLQAVGKETEVSDKTSGKADSFEEPVSQVAGILKGSRAARGGLPQMRKVRFDV